jgi:hypothetical protein
MKDNNFFEGAGKVKHATKVKENQNNKHNTPIIYNEHAIETYKSLINISLAGLKLLALLNGGAAVALLTFVSNIYGKNLPVPDILWAMGCFLGGLAFCGVAFFFSYLTQFILYQEVMEEKLKTQRNRHIPCHRFASIFSLLSLIAFIIGSLLAVIGFKGISK